MMRWSFLRRFCSPFGRSRSTRSAHDDGSGARRRAFLAGATAFTGMTALGPAARAGASPADGSVAGDTVTGPFRVTGASAPTSAFEVGTDARRLRAWVSDQATELSTSDRSPIRFTAPTRWDSDDTASPGGSGFTINRPATVWRQTGEAHKGAMLEFQQWLEAGPHQYGVACDNYGRTFDVATAGYKRVGWILAHYDSPTPERPPIHQHLNFETCKADLSTLVTRFQISWGEDIALCSFPHSDVRVYDRRTLRFGDDDDVTIRFDPTSARLAVAGQPWTWGDAVHIDPARGRLGVGVTAPAAPAHVQRETNGNSLLVRNTTAQGNNGANILADAQTPRSRLFQGGLQSDVVKRFSVEASGLLEWGPGGSSARDSNLYRHGADTLATDDDLRFDAAGRGPIVRSPNGTAYRVVVADDGTLGTEPV